MYNDKETDRKRRRKAIGAGSLDVVSPNVDLVLLDLLFIVAFNE